MFLPSYWGLGKSIYYLGAMGMFCEYISHIYIHHLANPANRMLAQSWILRSNRSLSTIRIGEIKESFFSSCFFFSRHYRSFIINCKIGNMHQIRMWMRMPVWMPLWNIRVFRVKLRASLITIDHFFQIFPFVKKIITKSFKLFLFLI